MLGGDFGAIEPLRRRSDPWPLSAAKAVLLARIAREVPPHHPVAAVVAARTHHAAPRTREAARVGKPSLFSRIGIITMRHSKVSSSRVTASSCPP
jgi:hypothetical protein